MYAELIVALAVTVVGAVVAVVRRAVAIGAADRRIELLLRLAGIATQAAEEVGGATALSGPDKLAVASEVLSSAARGLGIRVRPSEVTGYIHAVLAASRAYEQALSGFDAENADHEEGEDAR